MAEMSAQQDLYEVSPEQAEEDDLYEIDPTASLEDNVKEENQDAKISRRAMTAAATNTQYSDVSASEEAGVDTRPDAMRASQRASVDRRVRLGEEYMEQGGLSQEKLDELRSGTMLGQLLTPDVDALMADNNFGATERLTLNRIVAFDRIASEYLPQEDQGFWEKAGNVADLAVSSIIQDPVGLLAGEENKYFQGANVLIRMGERLSTLVSNNTISDDEYEERVRSILDEANDAGYFTDTNPTYLMQVIQAAAGRGVGPKSQSAREAQFLISAVELTPIGITGDLVRGVVWGARSIPSKAPYELVERVAGKEKAVEVGTDAVRYGPDAESSVISSLPTAMTPNTKASFAGPQYQILRNIEAENEALEMVRSSYRGTGFDETLFAERVAETQTKIKERLRTDDNSIIDIGSPVNIGLDNYVIPTIIGRPGGKPFLAKPDGTAPNSLVELAEKTGGRLEEVTYQGKKAYSVVVETNVKMTDLNNPLDMNEVGGYLTRVLSTSSRTSDDLNRTLKTAEASTARVITELNSNLEKSRKGAGRLGVDRVDDIYNDLTNDPKLNSRTEPLTEEEFVRMYVGKFSERPKEKVLEYWRTFSDYSDMEYFIRADEEFKKAVANNEVMVRLSNREDFVRAQRVEQTPNRSIWDQAQGKYVKPEEAEELGTIYRLDPDEAFKDLDGKDVAFVVERTPAERRLYHTDVMGYNVGAHRVYAQARQKGYFIRQENILRTVDGDEAAGTPKTFMRVETNEQAISTVNQFNTIVDNIGASNIDEIIKRNNDWNPSMQTLDDFLKFADEQGLDPQRKIGKDADGERLSNVFSSSDTVNNAFVKTAMVNRRRGVKPLVGYGGSPLETLRASDAIPQTAIGSLMRNGYYNYVKKAQEQLYEAVKIGDGTNPAATNMDEVKRLWESGKRRQAIDAMEWSDTPLKSKFDTARHTLQFATGAETIDIRLIRAGREALRESVLDENFTLSKVPGFKQVLKGLSNTEIEATASLLRSLAFNLKLGLFAVDQLWVQASTLFSSTAIASSTLGTINALRTASVMPVVRMALMAPDNAQRGILRLAEGLGGFTAKEIEEVVEITKKSGRLVLEATAMEENVGFSVAKNIGQKVADKGRFAFDEGERINRITAMLLSYKSLKKKYPKVDPTTDGGVQWIVGESDKLTQSMTNTSSAAFQKSFVGSAAFQFLSYQRNVMEQMFGSVLTASEKRRLVTQQVLMYGAAGVPLANWAMDRAEYNYGSTPNDGLWDDVYKGARYGLLDSSLEIMTGVETDVGSRIGAGSGVWSFFRDMQQTSMVELLGGPGLETGKDVLSSVKGLISSVVSGNPSMVKSDLHEIARNATAYDKATKAWLAVRTNQYHSRRTGKAVVGGLDQDDAIAILTGMPLREVQKAYTVSGFQYADRKTLDKIRSDLRKEGDRYARFLEEGKTDAALQSVENINQILSVANPWERRQVISAVQDNKTLTDKIVETLWDQGRFELAKTFMGDE